MKSLLCAIFTGALLCGIALAQDSTPSSSASQQQTPTRQAPSEEQAAPSAPDSQAPAAQPTSPAQGEAPTRQSPSGEQAALPAPDSQAPATQPTSPAQGEAPTRQSPSGEQAAQPYRRSAPQVAGVKRLAPGSVIPVQLTKSIDAKKVKTGDEVVAIVTQDMKTNSGEVIFVKDTKVIGHVTEAQPRSKEQKESQVGIAFDRAVMKNGSEMQMPMSIQAIIGQQNNNANANASPAPENTSAGMPTGSPAGRNSGMSGSPPPAAAPASGNQPTDEQNTSNARAPITAETRGVVGMPNLKLESAGQPPNQGSVVTSEKNNVKLDSGTMLLLRVNQ